MVHRDADRHDGDSVCESNIVTETIVMISPVARGQQTLKIKQVQYDESVVKDAPITRRHVKLNSRRLNKTVAQDSAVTVQWQVTQLICTLTQTTCRNHVF